MTKEIGNSDILDTWAASGVVVAPSGAKIDNGWDLGEQPPHEYANWLANSIGKAVNHILQNGIPAWNATTAYLTGNIAQVSGTVYRAKADNTNDSPPSNTWQAIAEFPVKNSLENDAGAHQLVGDAESPGNDKIYGTNASGVKGWQPAPAQAGGFKTGDIKTKYGNSPDAGFVRLNGLTIGNAASVATERADADTEALFIYLWDEDPNIVVSGARGASAADDYAANKRITLPDVKGRNLVAIDGMGGANASRITDTGDGNSGIDGTVLGASGGVDRHQLIVPEMPSHTHEGTKRSLVNIDVPQNNFWLSDGSTETGAAGGDLPHTNLQPTIIIGTVYLKL